MNPCPCGHLGDIGGQCSCTPDQVARYRARISGPLLDRIDLQLFMPRVEREQLFSSERAESSAAVRERVQLARKLQLMRPGKPNAKLGVADLGEHVEPKPDASLLQQRGVQKLGRVIGSGWCRDRGGTYGMATGVAGY